MNRLFFSNVKCNLGPYKGEVTETKISNFTETLNTDPKSVSKIKKREDEFIFEGKKLIIPLMPVTDIKFNKDPPKQSKFPLILKNPLVQDENGEIIGYKSGVRSCIVEFKNKVYRLKGCGNNYDFFPLRKVDLSDGFEIRGCMFEHTCFRELFMFYKINKILEENEIPVSHKPLGFFLYKKDEKDYPKYCAVYESFAEKRLNDHILLGLEIILPLFMKKVDKSSLLFLFNDGRIDNEGGVFPSFCVQLEGQPFENYLDLFNFDKYEFDVPKTVPEFVSDEWKALWIEKCNFLRKKNPKKIFQYIYWKLGREVGRITSILHKNGISWGTYMDRLGMHCNSHPNNVALICDKNNKTGMLLSPLDFDMALEKDSYVIQNSQSFSDILKNEKTYMILALSGCDAINTGSKGAREFKEKEYSCLLWGLRDTLMRGFHNGFDNKEDYHEKEKYGMDEIFSLIILALIATEKDIA